MFRRKRGLTCYFYLAKYLLSILFLLMGHFPLFSLKMDLDQLEKKAAKWMNVPSVSLKQVYGGFTNTSFSSTNQKDAFIVRLGKENPETLVIDRFCEVACQKSANKIGIAPEVLYSNPKNGILISSFINGKTYATEDVSNPVQLERIIELLKKCHTIPFKKEFKTFTIYEKIRKMILSSQSYKNSLVSPEESVKKK